MQESRQSRASAAAIWSPLARFIETEARLGHWAGKRRPTAVLYEFFRLTRTWLYPHQRAAWSMVSLGKLSSWFLLLIISYVMVAAVNRPAQYRQPE